MDFRLVPGSADRLSPERRLSKSAELRMFSSLGYSRLLIFELQELYHFSVS